MKKNTLYKVVTTTNHRLAEMGIIKGTTFRVVKIIYGIIQLRFKGFDILIREEMKKEITYEKIRLKQEDDFVNHTMDS